jgi:hypothetical protein
VISLGWVVAGFAVVAVVALGMAGWERRRGR